MSRPLSYLLTFLALAAIWAVLTVLRELTFETFRLYVAMLSGLGSGLLVRLCSHKD